VNIVASSEIFSELELTQIFVESHAPSRHAPKVSPLRSHSSPRLMS
jgi:hypothetical protein